MSSSTTVDSSRHSVLDGWRGISILLVLASHLLPLGPKTWKLNETAGPMGMALFFTLSGFLITRSLLQNASITNFVIRRFFRIIPLAWVAMAVTFPLTNTDPLSYIPNFFFYANLPPQHLTDIASHFWSLCVEMQFYVGIAMLVGLTGRRGLYLLPLFCLAITFHRITAGAHVDIVTWRRGDEILAGSILALVYAGKFGAAPVKFLSNINVYLLIVLFITSSHPSTAFFNYFRPYFTAMLVGTTLLNVPRVMGIFLRSRLLAYIATVSFAVYVIHHLLIYSWLGSGDKWVKYSKRPLLILVTFALAHLSTFHFERRCTDFGKRLSMWLNRDSTLRGVG